MNILIVDDEELAVQGILDGVNWEQLRFDKVLTARSYEDAVSIFGNTYIDILVSDIEMPGGKRAEADRIRECPQPEHRMHHPELSR